MVVSCNRNMPAAEREGMQSSRAALRFYRCHGLRLSQFEIAIRQDTINGVMVLRRFQGSFSYLRFFQIKPVYFFA